MLSPRPEAATALGNRIEMGEYNKLADAYVRFFNAWLRAPEARCRLLIAHSDIQDALPGLYAEVMN